MATNPEVQTTTPTPAPRKRPWLALILGAILVGVGAAVTWHFLKPPPVPTAKTTQPARPPAKPYTIDGTISQPAKPNPSAAAPVTITVLQPTWTPEQRQEWEKRVNETLARAAKEVPGNDPPPAVTADPASVRRADQAMARRHQAASAPTPWKRVCTTEFLTLLKENSVEAGRATAAPDGTFSIPVAPPAGIPYILHAKGPTTEWLDTLRRGSNRIEFNDSNLIPE